MSEPPAPLTASRWLPLLLALGLTLVFFHRALFSANVFFVRDVQRVYVPLWDYWRERVLGGEFPQWYPFDGLGEPYVGMVISSAFHPAHLVTLLLPGAQGLKWIILLCYPVAFLGMQALARRLGWGSGPALLTAVSYTFSGYLVGITNNPLYLMAAVTVPWVFWALEGALAVPTVGRGLGAAVLLGLVLFTGDVQGYAVCLGGVLLWSVCRPAPEGWGRSLGKALGVEGLSVLLAAVQILPAWQGLGSVNASGQTLEAATVWSVHPVRLVELFVGPLFAGGAGRRTQIAISQQLLSTSRANLWVESFFIGAPVLVLAGTALVLHARRPRAWVLTAAALGVLLLALGKHTALYAWVFEWVPPWRSFRYPEKLMPFVTFTLALAAGVGLEGLERAPTARRWVGVFAGGLGLGVLALGGLEASHQVFTSGALSGLWVGEPWPEAQRRIGGQFIQGCGVAGVSLLLMGGLLGWGRSRGAWAGGLGALCFAGLGLENGSLYKVGHPHLFDAPPPFARRILEAPRAERGPPPRLFYLPGSYSTPNPLLLPTVEETDSWVTGAALVPLVPALFGLESASAHLPGVSRRVLALWNDQWAWVTRAAALFHTRYLVISRDVASQVLNGPRREVARMEDFGLLLLEDTSVVPRVYLAHPRCVTGPEEALRRLGGLQAPREAVVECVAPLPESSLAVPLGAVTAARFMPERVEVEVNARGGEVLVLNDAFYSGWTASVDGRPTPILPANEAVRAVVVPPGMHRIVFRYRTPWLLVGAWVSVGTLLVVLWAAVETRRGRRGAHPETGA